MNEPDYIIVGAGSAGCVLAARLSADPGIRVLLVEAGGTDRSLEVRMPAAFPKLFRTPRDWAFSTEPQRHLGGREMFHPRGKVLGGSSSINAMIYMRGHPRDYDRWAELGCPGWSYREVLPYFTRNERETRFDPALHGRDGPQSVEPLRSPNKMSEAFVASAIAAGHPRNDDFNGAVQDGVGLHAVTQRRGQRASAAAAYLAPNRDRSNLNVGTSAQALAVMFEGKRAVGLRYRIGSEVTEWRAAREVILAAGAIQSPQLLMLSGIGPADHLRSHGIAVVHDSPGVGQHLQDHLLVPLCYRARYRLTIKPSLWGLLRFLLCRRGPLTSNLAEAGLFCRTLAGLDAPDLQVLFAPVYFLNHGFTQVPGDGFTLGPVMLQPASSGSVSLRSADPLQPPRIDPNYLAEPSDRRLLIEGLRLCRQIVKQEPLAGHAVSEYVPGAEKATDDELLAHIQATADTCYHPTGTCRMGSDPAAVVDPTLRVNGVEGLRVVDASVMPEIVRGNTNAPTMMIAEKAAEMIIGKGRGEP